MFRKRQRSPSIGGHERTRKRRKSTLISSAKSAVKILLPVLQEACETFPYLHPVASFIEYMLNHIESLEENREDLEIVIRRIRKVLELLAGPSLVPNSERHVEALKAELQEINATLIPIQKRSMISGFFKATDDAKVIKSYIPRLERALLDYQLAMTHELYKLNIEQISNDELLILNSIDRAKDAGFEAMNNPSVCLEGTRAELLRSLQQWAADWDVLQLHWLNGHAGGGKSTIARSFARLLFSNGDLGASFFCSRDSQHRSDVKMVFPTIAFQLARSRNDASPEFRAAIVRTLKANPDVASLSLQQQLQELILEPVTKSGMKTVIIIDALDECKDEEPVSTILSLLARTVKNAPTIKVFITSRPEYHIRSKFHFPELRGITETTTLHVEGATSVNADIRLYLHTSLAEIADDRNQLPGYEPLEDWPNQSDVDLLTAKAAGLFIFASTVIRFIASPYHDPRDQLKKIITDLRDFRHEGQQGLDALYLGVLRRAVPPWDDSEFLERLRSILGLLVVGYDIFTPVAIAELFEFPRHTNVWDSLNSLRSVLLVPDNANEPIRFHHKSFPDFLTSSSRCTNLGFWIDCDHHHFKISVVCLRLMKRKLKRNVCDLPRYTINDAVNESLIEQSINEATRYSCRYWACHLLCDSRLAERFSDIKPFITHFLTKQQLQWVEALGLLQELRHAVHSLSDLRDWFTKHRDQHQDLLEWVLDGHRFILQSFDVIGHSVAQIYHSALPFAPRKSLLRQQHAESLLYEVQVRIGTEEHWHGPIRTIHTQEAVTTLEYSRDGNILAVCLKSSVDIYLSATGELLFEFKLVSSEHIRSITFSADERILAAVSGKGITLWEIATGSVMTEIFAGNLATAIFHPLSEHADLLVSADNVGRIALWNSDTKSCQQISGVEKSLGQLCWLGAMKAIVVGCEYGRAEVWIVDPGLPRRENVFELPSEPGTTTGRSKITALSSSEDGLLVALGSEKGALGLYDANTSILLRYIPRATALDGARISSSRFASIIYGSSPRIVISSIRDTIVRVCDLSGNHDPHVVSFEGHSRGVGCATFSPGGRLVASGSVDHTVRIWDAAPQHSDHFGRTQPSSASKYHRHSKKITSICFSLDGRLVASGSADCTVMIWDTDNCMLRATLRGIHPQPIWQAIILAGNLHVAAFTDQGNVVVWDLSRGQQLIQKSVFGAGDDLTSSLILPYSHNAEGFFYCPTIFTPETGLTTRQIDCWTIIYDTQGRLRLVLAAQGVIPYQELVVRIRHTSRTSEDNDLYLTLHVICRSGKRLSAIWTRATTTPRSPQQLVFLEESSDSILDADDPLVCADGVFPYIPAAHRGISSWHGQKLALGADSGRFTLMDFSRVDDTQN